ncbi:MAG TPA: CXXX repeat peptide maturase [Candidatus Kryptonia bacterium]
MKFLILPVDKSSVSFCFYANRYDPSEPEPIPKATIKTAVNFACTNGLTIHFLYGRTDPPSQYKRIIESINHVKIVPLTLAKKYPESIVVIDSEEIERVGNSGLDPGRNVIVRLSKEFLPQLAAILPRLFGIFQRLNLCIVGMESITEIELDLYGQQLLMLAESVSRYYRQGNIFELNLLSDRIVLDKMKNCDAGCEHFTVGPDGRLYLCPGFLYDDPDASVGSLEEGIHIPNPELLRLDHAPICSHCDAYQCMRCIYLNKKLTLEVNTPSHQQCVASHKERSGSEKILTILRDIPAFAGMKNIPPIDYDDPLILLRRSREQSSEGGYMIAKTPVMTDIRGQTNPLTRKTTEQTLNYKSDSAEQPSIAVLMKVLRNQEEILELLKKGAHPFMNTNKNDGNSNPEPTRKTTAALTKKIVGSVAPAERDEIRALFERKNGLTELFRSLSSLNEAELQSSALYERIVADMGDVSVRFQKWWDAMSKKYSWDNIPGYKWEIDFDSCEIYLEKQ